MIFQIKCVPCYTIFNCVMSYWTILQTFWIIVNHLGLISTMLDEFRQYFAILDDFQALQTICQPFGVCLDLFGPFVDQYGPIWTHLNLFGPIWTHFKPFQPTVWKFVALPTFKHDFFSKKCHIQCFKNKCAKFCVLIDKSSVMVNNKILGLEKFLEIEQHSQRQIFKSEFLTRSRLE